MQTGKQGAELVFILLSASPSRSMLVRTAAIRRQDPAEVLAAALSSYPPLCSPVHLPNTYSELQRDIRGRSPGPRSASP